MNDTQTATTQYVYCSYCGMWYDALGLPHSHDKYISSNAQIVIDYRDKLDRIIKLLESIEYQLRTK